MKTRYLLPLLIGISLPKMVLAQAEADAREIPLPVIHTAAKALPGPEQLPAHPALPDIMLQSDGQRVTSTAQWQQQRTVLKSKLAWYATGQMPPAPGAVQGRQLKSASLLNGTVNYRLVRLSFGPRAGQGFDIAIFTPVQHQAPLPAVMYLAETTPGADALPLLPRPPGQGHGVNALLPAADYVPAPPAPVSKPAPAPVASDSHDPEQAASQHRELFRRGYALVTWNYQDTGEDTTLRQDDGSWSFRTTRQFAAWPGYDWGLAAGWAWGMSRVIDFIEHEPDIDASKLIATGHSRRGKAVLIAGAFDERIALTAPAGSGAAGTAAYRFTGAGRGGKEGLDDMMRKYPNWFSPQLHAFRGQVDKLPFDQHEFIALVAPRAFISLEGSEDQNCVPDAVRQAFNGARPAWALYQAEPRLGVSYAAHRHSYEPADWHALLDFADWQLLGKAKSRSFDRWPEAGK